MKTKYIISIAAALALVTATSCQRENLTVNTSDSSDVLKFSVGFAGSGEINLSKGATLASEDGTVSIPLSCTVTDGIGVNLPDAMTKGTQINSEGEFLGAELTSFTAAGWSADKTEFIPSSTAVSYSDGLWQTAGTYRWRGNGDKVFLAYANLPSSGASVTNYINPSVKQTFTYTVPTDARQQNDIMLGWYKGDGGGTATAAITMVHPLTAVVFKKGEMEGITAIKSISIFGVYVNGTADVTYDLSDGDIIPTYDWKAGTGADTRTGSQAVTLSPAGEATELEVAADGKIGTSFIILPQIVATNSVVLRVVVERDGSDVELLAYLPAGKWEEGKTNTFTIGYTPTYHVTYNLNGVSDSAPVDSESYESGSSATVLAPEGTPTKDDLYTFIRWNTADDGSGKVYYPGDNIVITGNVTLYAQYSSTLARSDSFNTAVGNATNVTFGNYNTYSSIVGPWENGTGTGDGSKSESIRIFKLNDNKDVYVLSKGVIYFGEDCHDMFLGKTLLQSIDFGSNVIDTRNVTQFRCMFSGCSNLTTLDLSDFDTRGAGTHVNDNGKIFENCSNLETIYVGERWDLYTRTNSSDNAECFTGCTSLVGGNGTTYSDSHKGIDYARIDGQGGNPGYLTRSE